MTGGGFGGCTVNLIRRTSSRYSERRSLTLRGNVWLSPDIYAFKAADGASEIEL